MIPKSIKVIAVPGVIAPRPRHGGHNPYIGRDTDHEAIKAGKLAHDDAYPIQKEGEEITSAQLDIFQHVARYVRDGSLLAADEATASYCGVKPAPKEAPASKEAALPEETAAPKDAPAKAHAKTSAK